MVIIFWPLDRRHKVWLMYERKHNITQSHFQKILELVISNIKQSSYVHSLSDSVVDPDELICTSYSFTVVLTAITTLNSLTHQFHQY